MDLAAPKGWHQDSETCYLHDSGDRIERRVYREKEGWFLIPADLDRAVLGFAPDSEGLEQALAAFDRLTLTPAPAKDVPEGEGKDDGGEDPENLSEDDEADEGDV